jgi:hypothetical protein
MLAYLLYDMTIASHRKTDPFYIQMIMAKALTTGLPSDLMADLKEYFDSQQKDSQILQLFSCSLISGNSLLPVFLNSKNTLNTKANASHAKKKKRKKGGDQPS